MYASLAAQNEIERLTQVSINKNPSVWEINDDTRIRLSFLNCRSMKNKFEHIATDESIIKSDVIMLSETWLEPEQEEKDYQLENFSVNLISEGRGRGLASYFNKKFQHVKSVKNDGYSLSKVSSEKLDVFGIYRSKDGDARKMIGHLEEMIIENRTTIIGGDLNVCALKHQKNFIIEKLKELDFQQIVKQATHIEGGLIDHLYIKQGYDTDVTWELEVVPKYFTDHDCIRVTVWRKN